MKEVGGTTAGRRGKLKYPPVLVRQGQELCGEQALRSEPLTLLQSSLLSTYFIYSHWRKFLPCSVPAQKSDGAKKDAP